MAAEALFSFLAEKGLGRRKLTDKAIANVVAKAGTNELVDLCKGVSAHLPFRKTRVHSPFAFIATSTLGGGPEPCAGVSCRVAEVDKLSRFAALYADEVLIPDPFDLLSDRLADETWLEGKQEFLLNLLFLYKLGPLIKAGLVAFAESKHFHLCADCYARSIGESSSVYVTRLSEMHKYLRMRFQKGIQSTLIDEGGELVLRQNGPEALIPHRTTYLHFQQTPDAIANLSTRTPYRFKAGEVRSLGLTERLISPIMDDLLRQNYYSNFAGTGYLTSRDIDFDVIKKLGAKSLPDPRLATLADSLSHSLPVMLDVDVKRILKLRSADGEAFRKYRHSLSKALELGTGKTKRKDFDQIFSDVVRPEIDEITMTIRRSRRSLMREIGADIAVALGGVGFGLFNGVLPATLGAALGALGTKHYSSKVFRNVAKLASKPASVMDSRYYFLWKLSKSSRRIM